jgi:hypothetical protein
MALCVVTEEEIGVGREFNFAGLESDKSYWLQCCVWKGDEGTGRLIFIFVVRRLEAVLWLGILKSLFNFFSLSLYYCLPSFLV